MRSQLKTQQFHIRGDSDQSNPTFEVMVFMVRSPQNVNRTYHRQILVRRMEFLLSHGQIFHFSRATEIFLTMYEIYNN